MKLNVYMTLASPHFSKTAPRTGHTIVFWHFTRWSKAQIPLRRLPRNFRWHMSRGSFGEVGDMDHVTGKSRRTFGVPNRRMLRWFEKFPWQVGNKPVCVEETGKSATPRTNQRGRYMFVADLSRTSRGSRHNGIWTLTTHLRNDGIGMVFIN